MSKPIWSVDDSGDGNSNLKRVEGGKVEVGRIPALVVKSVGTEGQHTP